VIRLTRRYRFDASHRLDSPRLSAGANRELYGRCNNPYGHGHGYVLEVSVRAPLDVETGLSAGVGALDSLVGREILAAFDHRNLNLEIPAFRDSVPTAENLAAEIRRRLLARWDASSLAPAALDAVRVRETKNNSVELPS
jgi:6-pyruvoyltetrahydropterin/6-carboxytetrahydropterin synthase